SRLDPRPYYRGAQRLVPFATLTSSVGLALLEVRNEGARDGVLRLVHGGAGVHEAAGLAIEVGDIGLVMSVFGAEGERGLAEADRELHRSDRDLPDVLRHSVGPQ